MDLERKNRAYRRALALGLTLAEIFVLLVFILLLAFAALYQRSFDPSSALISVQRQYEQQSAQIKALAEVNTRLQHENARLQNKFDDLFRDLQLQRRQTKQFEAQLAHPLEEAFGPRPKDEQKSRASSPTTDCPNQRS